MASRTSWEGYLKLNLLSVPVKAYSATTSGSGKIGFHLIHAKCHSRIRYKKVCPTHGEVPNDEIVSAYEFAKGQYVVVDSDERNKLLPVDDKAITIDTFIRTGDLDPIYYADRSYYLVPDGRVAQKPYAVIQRVMAEQERLAIARIIMSGREHVVVVRPLEGLLAMTLLNYDEQVKKPSEFVGDVPDVAVAAKELQLAESLIEASTADGFDFAAYRDEYTGNLAKLLESKAAGKKVVREHRDDEPVVVNLMDALRRSLADTQRGTKSKTKPTSKAAKTHKTKKTTRSSKVHRASGRRKTG